jgi:TolB-like protein
VNPGKFFAELKRRNVYKVSVAYAVVSWLLIQIATQVFPFFEIPNWVVRLVVVVIILGFPVALVSAWAFELTPEGLKRDEATNKEDISRPRNHAWIYVVVVAIALSIATFFIGRHLSYHAKGVPEIAAKSIAVLPLENLSSNQDDAFFADGIQDDILTSLAKIGALKVISRTSVMQYKTGAPRNLREIGQQLGVAHLLEGSVQRAGGKVRVNAQLIDARSDAHQWAQSFDRDLADVFAIQSEIAKAIADQLQAKLSPTEKTAIERKPTNNVSAFDLYSRAKTLLLTTSFSAQGAQNILQAVDLLNQTVERDPSFFQAYCLLAYSHDQLYFLGNDHTPARLAQAEAAIQAAFRLQPEAGEVHLNRAEQLYRA